jgi:hypothetical protein
MKHLLYILLSVVLISLPVMSQRDSRTHTRSMLRQTIYNTGELGRALEGSNSTEIGLPRGTSSLEWPPNSYQILDGITYYGQQNSQGAGLVLRALVRGTYETRACGGITDGAGNTTPVAGVFVNPGDITRIENFPILADGSLNLAYDPNEAEEKIVTKYTTTLPIRLTITQTSRAWSFPGYDAFIILEYDIENTDTVDYMDGFVMFQYAFCPSAFGLMRKYGIWNESSTTSRNKEEYARYNFSRLMCYLHTRDGFPEPVPAYFNKWSTPGNRGGLNSPQAVGFLPLHYDTEHLQLKENTVYAVSDSGRVWGDDGKFRQPYSTETNGNRNQDLNRTINLGLTLTVHNPSAFNNKVTASSSGSDSALWANYYSPSQATDPIANQSFIDYWHGKMKPRAWSASGMSNSFFHYTSFGPYVFKKNEHLKFATAFVVGYGPGTLVDTVWKDGGGASQTATSWFFPVPSWYDSLTYPGVSLIGTSIGSAYLKTHELPWYVTAGKGISRKDSTPVISVHDVADRAIQMYTGVPLKKYDGVQFMPETTPATGAYSTTQTYIPIPAPQLFVYDAVDVKNRLVWGPQVEGFTSLPNVRGAVAAGRIKAGLSYYIVLKSPEGLGPWLPVDTVSIRDPRYYNVDSDFPNQYVFRDKAALLSENYYYAVISVDSLGGKSGMTNMSYHKTNKGAVGKLGGKLYVAPNPLILSSHFGGSTMEGDINDKIGFYGLPKRCTIRVFSYSGQLIGTVEHRENVYSHEWFQISRNSQRIAAGVYFYTVEDLDDGKIARGKFVIIH